MIYIVIACHFKDPSELCQTTIARLQAVLKVVDKENDRIIVTGDVPYAQRTSTLGDLMNEYLIKEGFPNKRVSKLLGAVNTFSEARIACRELSKENITHITMVSSRWYMFYGKKVWDRRATEKGIRLSVIAVEKTGGWHTILTYISLGVINYLSILVGMEKPFENYVTSSHQKRKLGFTWDGCR